MTLFKSIIDTHTLMYDTMTEKTITNSIMIVFKCHKISVFIQTTLYVNHLINFIFLRLQIMTSI